MKYTNNYTNKTNKFILKGYIQSKSIIKLVLALKAKAIPLRSLTSPTKVL